jgi:type VI secretion system protein ImpK
MAQQPPPDDPFAALDTGRTFILPTPGARTTVGVPRSSLPAAGGAEVAQDVSAPDTGLNPLVALAHPLLMLVAQIRATSHVADPAALKEQMAQGLREFESRARAQAIAPERVLAARYILCTVLDEAAGATPWGGSGQWARNNLLVTFHNEAYGGEKVFQLMVKLAEDPKTNRDLLELIYATVNMGFEGRYRVVEGGRAKMEAVREQLAQMLKKARGDHASPLAQNWQGQTRRKRPALTWLPLWISAVAALLLLVGIYFLLANWLGDRSDPVYGEIQGLRLQPPVPAAPAPAAKPRLAQFLEADIRAGLVTVRDEVDRSVVTVRGDGLFSAGSATLASDREALMRRIADAVSKVGGGVLVTGHTDSQPIRGLRFPSNWHLSQERARAVGRMLIDGGVTAERVRTEGRADSEPVAPNDTAENRARNRRVEVVVFVGPSDAGLPAVQPPGPTSTPAPPARVSLDAGRARPDLGVLS